MRWESQDLTVEVLHSVAGLATQILVQAGSVALLFDAGDGTLRDLHARGISPHALTGVFFTHGHADHMAGLYGLLGYLRAEGHKGEFHIWYPRGACEVEEVLAAFHRCYRANLPYALKAQPLQDGECVRLGELEVWAKAVTHWHSIQGNPLAPAPALGYRLVFRNQTVAITGDSAMCPALVDLVRGADLALIEATLKEDAPEEQRRFLHLTREQAETLGRLAKRAYFVHTRGVLGREP